MKPLSYKQRPTFPTLIGAVASLLAGLYCFAMIYQRVQSGEIGEEKMRALILLSFATSGIFLVAVFARYQFTHLRKKQRRK